MRSFGCIDYDHYLIAAWGGGGLWIWDLYYPESETPIGWIQLSNYCYDSLVFNNSIYIAAGGELVIVHPEFYSNGDVNQDGIIDATDILLMSQYFSERFSLNLDSVLMDVNRDGIADLTDLVTLRRLCIK